MSRFEAVFHDGSFQVSGALNRMMSQPPAVHQFLYGVPELAPKVRTHHTHTHTQPGCRTGTHLASNLRAG